MTKILTFEKSRRNHAEPLNPETENVPGFPPIGKRSPYRYSDADIRAIVGDAMSDAARRNWLTGALAKGEIDQEQLRRFWPGDGA